MTSNAPLRSQSCWYYGGSGGHGEFDAYSAQSKSIGDLLSDSLKGIVEVPQFQRGYSWSKKHVNNFPNSFPSSFMVGRRR
jgi:hypothetical protein